MSEEDEAVALDYVVSYAANAVDLDDDATRYMMRSAQFAQAGGAIGSLIGPPVGTAIGAMVGAQVGVVWEAVGDVGKWLFGDAGPKRVRESAEDAERAYYTYGDLGFEEGTGLPYDAWWKLYVAAGRPPVEVLLAAKDAERAAQRILRAEGRAENSPPAPPPATKTNFLVPLLLALGIAATTIGIGKAVRS